MFFSGRCVASLTLFVICVLPSIGMAASKHDMEQRSSLPSRFGMVLFPAFQALDVFGPLDALNMLSLSHQMDLALIAETLSPVSTQARSAAMNAKNSTFGESVLPTHTFATAPPLDVLIVPGGIGTRSPDLNATIDFIRTSFPSLQYLITVCTGAGLAARAGVLDGRRATTNKAAWNSTTALGPNVDWVSHARWVDDGNIWTSSGVSAGIDATLAWIKAVYGDETASRIANYLGYVRHEDASWDPFADLYNIPRTGET